MRTPPSFLLCISGQIVTPRRGVVGLLSLVCAVAVSTGLSDSKAVSAQELIAPGTPASELPAPRSNQPKEPTPNPFFQQDSRPKATKAKAADAAVDPMEEYRRSLEEHILRKEKAKAEARARFESRSLDLIPRLTPTKPKTNQRGTSDLTGDDDLLPTPRRGSADEIASPSDLLDPPDRDLDDLLLPLQPRDRDISDLPDRKLPPPLSRDSENSNERPSRLGGDRSGPSTPNSDPPSKSNDSSRGWNRDRDSDDDSADSRRTNSGNNVDRNDHSQSVLETPIDPNSTSSTHWTGLVENEMARWPMPASFRPNMPVSQVTCSSCGGCVDRHGVGVCDKVGVYVGVGTREKPACQCWRCPQSAPFNLYGPGGYAGPARSAPLPEYRLRAGDQVQMTFLIKTIRTVGSYRLVVGDELLIESDADENLTRGTLERGLEIQPDGTLTLRFIGQVHAAGQTIEQLRDLLNERYEEYYPDPSIDVTPVRTGNVARQIREAISGSEGFNPQQTVQTVTPEGTLRLPRLGAIPTQGLTMAELKREINLRYESLGAGLEVEVMLEEQAPHYVYVLGEVATPGRFEIDAPTTVLGSLSLAGSYVPGANLRQVVVFRRGPNWELLSTVLDLRAALLAKASRPADEIWVQDGDVIIVPPAPIRLFDRFVTQVFTEGVYGIVPFGGVSFSFGNNN
ncbi:polysaccharide biosynthesis/export family protein [Aporhodopirellula aestuarii]|uniref:Polysaccharide biosynthesis/export family protein n=1 Tax=Aporhodopirellula aestuarii TaxID=2950107 RepID=A0ABT0UBB7_9BACT|nr:polysaccharide biosynthesis/export family protein [Aporhodopirellula aestuarii]MCM2374205.1 polysaccharide biosynthesis/export family protein [Aporhodopirellula aestuarii]